jgi:hypothetical protein
MSLSDRGSGTDMISGRGSSMGGPFQNHDY